MIPLQVPALLNAAGAGGDPLWDAVLLAVPFDGSHADRSPYALPTEIFNEAAYYGQVDLFGATTLFLGNGQTNMVWVNDADAPGCLDPIANLAAPWCMEVWANAVSPWMERTCLFERYNNQSGNYWYWRANTSSTGVRVYGTNGGPSWNTYSGVPTSNAWHHYCLQFDGTMLRAYVDGDFEDETGATDSNFQLGTGGLIGVGMNYGQREAWETSYADWRITAALRYSWDGFEAPTQRMWYPA